MLNSLYLNNMKQILLNNQRNIVLVSSIVGLLLFIAMLVHDTETAIRISSTSSELIQEFITMIYLVPLVIPAILGFLYLIRKSVKANIVVALSFFVYLIVNLITSLVYYKSVDALEGGLLFIIIDIPISIIISIVLGVLIF